jgi:non-ribosomal peptide synthetase component F
LYVLDEHLNPRPEGDVGDLYVAGAPVAAGYLDRPDLSLARFLPDPLATGAELMFRTGVRARRLPDGRIAFVTGEPPRG